MKKISNILSLALAFLSLGVFAAPTGWQINSAAYEYSQTLTSTVRIAEGVNAAENDMLAAFVNGQCRGIATATYVEAYESYYFFLTVFSNTYSGEVVEIKYYNQESDSIYDGISAITFADGANVGSASAPLTIGESESAFKLKLSNASIDENMAENTIVGAISALVNGVPSEFKFALLNNDNAFQIVDDTLYTSVSFNYEEQSIYQVKFLAYSADSSNIFTDSVDININDVLEPFELKLSNSAIIENNNINTFVGKLHVYADNEADTYTFKLDSINDFEKFYLSSDSVFAKESFNYEVQNAYQLNVIAINNLSDTVNQRIKISIENANEAPYNISLSNNTVAENRPSGTFIGLLHADDEDTDDAIMFQQLIPTGSDFTYFNIHGDSVFTYDVFDYEKKQSHSLMILATDKAGLESEKLFEILINDEDEVSVNIVEQFTFEVYPNPATRSLNIKNSDGISKIEIYNTAGKNIFSKSGNCCNIEIESLQSGLYFLKVFSQTKTGTKKFIKE